MTVRLFTRSARAATALTALALATVIGACSSAPGGDGMGSTDEAFVQRQAPTRCAPFSVANTCLPNTLCNSSCVAETGPVCTTLPVSSYDHCGAPVAVPSVLAGCTVGMHINAGDTWLCPDTVPTPTNIDGAPDGGYAGEHVYSFKGDFCSNCVGHALDGRATHWVVRYWGDGGGNGGCHSACQVGH